MQTKTSSLVTSAVCCIVLLLLGSNFVQKTRGQSRSRSCQEHLRYLALAMHNYHSTFKNLPPGAGGSTGGPGRTLYGGLRQSSQGRLSGFAAILPFIDQQVMWSKLSNRHDQSDFPSMGPSPSHNPAEYKLWRVQVDRFLCPSEPQTRRDFGLRSYVMNYGDAINNVGRLYYDSKNPEDAKEQRAVCRGVFMSGRSLRLRDILDGTSNTIMLSETKVGVSGTDSAAWIARGVDGLVEEPAVALKTVASDGSYAPDQSVWGVGKGSRWPEGSFVLNGFTTIMPPGGPSATLPKNPESGVVSASSHHIGGVHAVMCDGGVILAGKSIDTGDLHAASVTQKNVRTVKNSPYGVWGAMGTRAGSEIIPSEREADYRYSR